MVVRVRLVTRWLPVISITTIITNIMVLFIIIFCLYALDFNNFLILYFISFGSFTLFNGACMTT